MSCGKGNIMHECTGTYDIRTICGIDDFLVDLSLKFAPAFTWKYLVNLHYVFDVLIM